MSATTGEVSAVLVRHGDKSGVRGPKREHLIHSGLSIRGVEGVRESTPRVLEILKEAEPGTVLIWGIVSDKPRTISTADVVEDQLKRDLQGGAWEDIILLDKNKINSFGGSMASRLRGIKVFIEKDENKNKKIIISHPFFDPKLKYGTGGLVDNAGNDIPYVNGLVEKYGSDDAALKVWIETEGQGGGETGPSPTEVAKLEFEEIKRLARFAQSLFEGRKVILGGVHHSWALEVLAIYLANGGKVNADGLKLVQDNLIQPAEMISLISRNGKSDLSFGNLKIPVSPEVI